MWEIISGDENIYSLADIPDWNKETQTEWKRKIGRWPNMEERWLKIVDRCPNMEES
jgi:hypothetical protein